MKEQDHKLLSELEGEGLPSIRVRMCCLMRKGSLLIALPEKRELALEVLALYQPQNSLARLYILGARMLVNSGAWFFFKKHELELRESSPLLKIVGESQFGFLLGNPDGASRRAVCLHKSNGKSVVTKLGLGGAAAASVSKEVQAMASLPTGLKGPLEVLDQSAGPSMAYFTTAMVEGSSPQSSDQDALLELLTSWQREDLQPLTDLTVWNELYEAVSDRALLGWMQGLGPRLVTPSVVHGDFAPWNIKVAAQGKVSVVDWEFCRQDGVAGWDWAHYLTQVQSLVHKHGSAEVLDSLAQWAGSTTGKSYLDSCGWADNVQGWIGSYLLYTHYLLGQDRSDLILCWKKNNAIA